KCVREYLVNSSTCQAIRSSREKENPECAGRYWRVPPAAGRSSLLFYLRMRFLAALAPHERAPVIDANAEPIDDKTICHGGERNLSIHLSPPSALWECTA
ncbi:unnamed protein product, partial [Sphacelaria rigidula]